MFVRRPCASRHRRRCELSTTSAAPCLHAFRLKIRRLLNNGSAHVHNLGTLINLLFAGVTKTISKTTKPLWLTHTFHSSVPSLPAHLAFCISRVFGRRSRSRKQANLLPVIPALDKVSTRC